MTQTQVGKDIILGSGDHRYRVIHNWGKLPSGWEFKDAAGVAVDGEDRVYVFSRGGHPVTVFDRDGNMLSAWGENVFKNPHGLHIGQDGFIYCTDDGDHTVRKCTLDGKVVLTLGIPGRPAERMSGLPFNRCTHTALSPRGDIYVSDGYMNARVHKYAPDGKLLKSWGESGCEAGQFNTPHNIVCDDDGWVYVADREMFRIQVFDGEGKYEAQFNNLYRPCALAFGTGKSPLAYIGEIPPATRSTKFNPNLGAAVKVGAMDSKGLKVVARLGSPLPSPEPGSFIAPHGIAADSRGDIYVGEVSYTFWPQLWSEPIPAGLRSLSKLVKV